MTTDGSGAKPGMMGLLKVVISPIYGLTNGVEVNRRVLVNSRAVTCFEFCG
jgi:hypothetical protein